jgi:regulator of replication initiation timing
MEDNNLCKKMLAIESNIQALLTERKQSKIENSYLREKLTKMTIENSKLNEKIRLTSKSIKNLITNIKTNQHG